MSNEKIINVPLQPSVKAKLDKIADRNGRATLREAARIITEHVNGNANGGDK